MALKTNHRPLGEGLARGVRRRCPNCGRGALFRGYLAVAPVCSCCGHANGDYRSDDGPAYVTILVVGHVVIAPLLTASVVWQADWRMVVPAMLAGVGGLTLLLLPFVKGAFIGLQWAAGRAPAQ